MGPPGLEPYRPAVTARGGQRRVTAIERAWHFIGYRPIQPDGLDRAAFAEKAVPGGPLALEMDRRGEVGDRSTQQLSW